MEVTTREPISFAAGDTLQWRRQLPDYPANAGWVITYALVGGPQPITFNSTVDADGISFDIYVAPAITGNWAPGDYILVGYVGNGADRHQIYYADCPIYQNQEAAIPGQNQQTVAQQNLAQIKIAFSGHIRQ